MALAREQHPTVITLDVVLPGAQSGWDVLSQLKDDPLTASIPVIIVTFLEESRHGFALGASDYVVKPIAWEDLLGSLQKVIRGSAPTLIPFQVGDGETPPDQLNVTTSSSNPALVPNANVFLGGDGANRSLAVQPLAGQIGQAVITIRVSDGNLSAERSFTFTVQPPPPAPPPPWLAMLYLAGDDVAPNSPGQTGLTGPLHDLLARGEYQKPRQHPVATHPHEPPHLVERDRHAQLAPDVDPRAGVRIVAVDQRAIDVQQHRHAGTRIGRGTEP